MDHHISNCYVMGLTWACFKNRWRGSLDCRRFESKGELRGNPTGSIIEINTIRAYIMRLYMG